MTAEADPDALELLDLSAFMATHWQAVAARMADLPIYNSALAVHATGFRRAGDWRIGVVVTPWFMNVVAMPNNGIDLPGIGSKLSLTLPAGEIEGVVDGLGRLVSASLYSPMREFDAAEVAIAVAEAVLDQLFTAPEPPPPPRAPLTLNRRALFLPRARTEARP